MKKQLIILACCTAIMFLIFMFSQNTSSGEQIILPPHSQDPIEVTPKEIIELESDIRWIVDVKGEVQNPGVYEVESSLRIHEVIEQAGGFTLNANQNGLNLAQKIEDEMIIYVPRLGEDEEMTVIETQHGGKEGKVSLNKATLEQLQSLPGIGTVKAQSIIEYRTQQGAFKSIDDLINVSGIGSKTLESIRDLIGI